MEWKNKKVLVNGVTGFIGSNLSKKLLDMGAEIYSIDNFSYIEKNIAKKKLKALLNKVKLINADVSKKETWYNVPKDIEYIFHFAGPSSITLFNKNPEKCYLETVFGLFYAFEYSKENNVKVIYPSSGTNYSGNKMPHSEDIYTKPRNLYGAAKMACEALASSYLDYVNSIGLRIFAGYGPGEEWKKDFASPIYLFIKSCKEGESPVIFGDGSQTRDFIFVKDIVNAVIAAAESDYKGIINVGTGIQTSFNDLIKIINDVLGTDIKPLYIPKQKNYVESLKADIGLMKSILKIKPLDTKEGIFEFEKYLEIKQ